MASLNNIAENIAFSLNEQFNHTLKESVKNSIIDYRALLIRQDLEKNAISYTDYLQSYCVQLELVNRSECPQLAVGDFVLKSKEKIAKPIRLKTNGRSNFKFVGSVDRRKSFTFATGHEEYFLSALPFQKNVVYYTYLNGYLYVLNNIKLCKVLLEYVVANPTLIEDCDNVFTDDRDFPIGEDMLSAIKKMIKRDYEGRIQDGEEVNIQKDVNDTE